MPYRLPLPLLACLTGLAMLLAGGTSARGEADAAPAPGSDCAERTAQRVQEHYDGVRDLRARFVQTTRSVAYGAASPGAESPVRGEVVLAKPGRMRWSYTEPEPSLVVSDGETLWIYDPLAQEVQVMPMMEGFLSGAALQFLLGDGRLLEAFRVEARSCGEPAVDLVLRPRAPAAYEDLMLRVDAASGAVQETTVNDLFGNRTHIVFSQMETNRAPEASVFRFAAPEGTRVLRLAPGP